MAGESADAGNTGTGSESFNWGEVATMAVPFIGSMLGGSSANKSRSKEARKNREFQERMSNTAYQRSMADMRLAGLNPMLAYMQGGGSTPSGSMPDVSDIVSPAISSAQQSSRVSEEVKNMRVMNKKIEADTDLSRSSSILNSYLMNKAHADQLSSLSTARRTDAETDIAKAELARAKNLESVEKGEFGKVMAHIDRLMGALGLADRVSRRPK